MLFFLMVIKKINSKEKELISELSQQDNFSTDNITKAKGFFYNKFLFQFIHIKNKKILTKQQLARI